MTTVETFYELPHCTTCQKAKAYLQDELGITIEKTVDVKTQQVDKETIAQLAEGVGGVEKLFSKRAMKYRAWGLNEKNLSEEDMLNYMHEEYTFIKRPVVVTKEGKTLSGFSKKQYDTLK